MKPLLQLLLIPRTFPSQHARHAGPILWLHSPIFRCTSWPAHADDGNGQQSRHLKKELLLHIFLHHPSLSYWSWNLRLFCCALPDIISDVHWRCSKGTIAFQIGDILFFTSDTHLEPHCKMSGTISNISVDSDTLQQQIMMIADLRHDLPKLRKAEQIT